MSSLRSRAALVAGLALWVAGNLLSGCGDDDSSDDADGGAAGSAAGSGGRGGGGGRAAAGSGGRAAAGSGGRGGSGGRAATSGGEGDLGAACEQDSDCSGGWFCDMEIPRMASVSGAPNGGTIDLPLFPGGSCTPIALGVYDPMSSCDPLEPRGSQGCTENGVCIPEQLDTETDVACRRACEPSASESGCPREGYTCDFGLQACIEGCQSDAECRIQLLDSNMDGDPDGAAYDRTSGATCDAKTARCTHSGGTQQSGANCSRDEDCADDGICITEDSAAAGHQFPDGYCTKIGCNVDGRGCSDGADCVPLRPVLSAGTTDPICLTTCTVGAEAESLRLGTSGHGQGCRAGYRCYYNGGVGAESGACVGGNYNAVTENNIGKGCEEDTECYSPYGAGRCLRYGLTNTISSDGICTILDCNAPGVPDDICGNGNECVASSADQTVCMHNCKDASECPATFACSDDDGVPASPSVCYPVCENNAECRPNEVCKPLPGQPAGQTFGQCVLQ